MYNGYYNQNLIKYAKSIDDVKREFVIGDTPFFSYDFSVMWLKNIKGEVKSYELKEIIQKDEKDLIIDSLQLQLKEKEEKIKELEYAKSSNVNGNEPVEGEESSNVSDIKSKKK